MCDATATKPITKEQYVYIMSNSSFDADVFKIGWTREHPAIRADDLHTSGVPTPFIVESVIITTEGVKLEKKIHIRLNQYRMENNREFFKISKNDLDEILTTELQLVLTSISELGVPTNKRTTCVANTISEMYETLKKDWKDFSFPLRKDKTELVVREIDNQKFVNLIKNEYNTNALKTMCFDEGSEERQIRNVFYFIEQDINQYKEHVDNILQNYKEIKERLGDKRFRECNKELKRWILDTHKDLNDLKNKYVWEF
jgi:hypothetical protein